MSAFTRASPNAAPPKEMSHKASVNKLARAFNPEVQAANAEAVISDPMANIEPRYADEKGRKAALIEHAICFLDGDHEEVDGWVADLRNGNKVFLTEGIYHREDGPCVIYPNGGEIWYQHGRVHRDEKDGPALSLTAQDGDKTIAFFRYGERHAVNQPAVTVFTADGSRWVKFFVNGKLHNTNGAAVMCINSEGLICVEEYLINGVHHRHEDEGPAIRWGRELTYMQEGEIHRLGGPARIFGKEELYYLQGVQVDKKAVSQAFLENRNATIGKAKATNPGLSMEDKQAGMKSKIESWMEAEGKKRKPGR